MGTLECTSLLGCPSNALARAGDPGASSECRQEACQQYSWDASLCGDQPVTEGLAVNQVVLLEWINSLCSWHLLASCWGHCSPEDSRDGGGYSQKRFPDICKVDNAGTAGLHYTRLWNRVYLHDNNTFLVHFLEHLLLSVFCTLLPLTLISWCIVWGWRSKGNSLCGYEVDLSPKPLSNPAWTVLHSPPSHTYISLHI